MSDVHITLAMAHQMVLEAVAAEREACAAIAEHGTPEQDWHPTSIMGQHGKKIAALIRERTQPQ